MPVSNVEQPYYDLYAAQKLHLEALFAACTISHTTDRLCTACDEAHQSSFVALPTT